MLIWKPHGQLDVSTEPTDLPETSDGKNIVSDAVSQCQNLRVNQHGKITLRDGSSKYNSSAINTAIWLIVCQAGVRYSFAGTNIYKNESSIASGLTSAQWSAIEYNQYNDTDQQIFALNGTDRQRINGSTASEWGIAAPTTAPTIAVGGSTGLTGAYNVKYTYCRKVSSVVVSESNPSDAATSAVTLADESLSVTWTASSDSQVTHVRVYRTAAGGSTYYLDQDVAIGTTTVDTTTADASLSSAVAINHDRPPLGSFVFGPNFDGTCFIALNNLLYYCLAKQPEYWPSSNYIEVSPPQFPIKTGVFHNGQPYVLTKNKIYYIQGTGSNTFFPLKMESMTGAQGIFGAVSIEGHGIYHTGPDGIYLYSGGDRKITENNFEPLFRGETVNGMPGVTDMSTAWLHQFGNNLYFGYTSSGYSYPTNILVYNLSSKRFTYYIYNDGSNVEVRCIATDETNNVLIIGDNTGYVRRIEDTTKTDDSGTAISWAVQSKDFTLQTRAHFPRWVKYDVDASNSTTATGEVYLDDTLHQSHTLSENRSIKRRLVKTGNGNKMKHKISGTGAVTIYAIESE